jgi:hypothetical protein
LDLLSVQAYGSSGHDDATEDAGSAPMDVSDPEVREGDSYSARRCCIMVKAYGLGTIEVECPGTA